VANGSTGEFVTSPLPRLGVANGSTGEFVTSPLPRLGVANGSTGEFVTSPLPRLGVANGSTGEFVVALAPRLGLANGSTGGFVVALVLRLGVLVLVTMGIGIVGSGFSLVARVCDCCVIVSVRGLIVGLVVMVLATEKKEKIIDSSDSSQFDEMKMRLNGEILKEILPICTPDLRGRALTEISARGIQSTPITNGTKVMEFELRLEISRPDLIVSKRSFERLIN
jgi:hypothetical protein